MWNWLCPFSKTAFPDHGVADIVDLGTGTGAIALSLLDQLPQLRAVGVDISAGALATARENAVLSNVSSRFAALSSNWFSELTGSYDMIISNPPYIRTGDIAQLQREVVLHDPVRALDGGPDGLEPYRIIADHAAGYLRPGGVVALEIGAGQRQDIEAIFNARNFVMSGVRQDFGGHDTAPSVHNNRKIMKKGLEFAEKPASFQLPLETEQLWFCLSR